MGILSSSPKLGESRAGGAGMVQHKLGFNVPWNSGRGLLCPRVKLFDFGNLGRGEREENRRLGTRRNPCREWSERRGEHSNGLGCPSRDSAAAVVPPRWDGSSRTWRSQDAGVSLRVVNLTLELCFELDFAPKPPGRAALKKFFS